MAEGTFTPLQPLNEQDAQEMRARLERVQREEREWLEARLHHALHGNWLSPDECAACVEALADPRDDDWQEPDGVGSPPDLNVEGDPTRNGAFG